MFVALADLHNSIHESGAKTTPMHINAAASFWANPSLFISQMKRVAATPSSVSSKPQLKLSTRSQLHGPSGAPLTHVHQIRQKLFYDI